MKFTVRNFDSFTLVEFELEGTITPDELKNLKPPQVPGSKGVIISGRGPIWLYGTLIHYFHPTAWVAVHDPRLGGGVVVETHTPDRNVGDVVKF